MRLELRGIKNTDGTFNAGVFVEGVEDGHADLILQRGTAKHLRELWLRAKEKYFHNPEIAVALAECFPESFLEENAENELKRDEKKIPAKS